MRRVLFGLLAIGVLNIVTTAAWPPVVTVLTDSMAPKIDAGDAVIVFKEPHPSVGDIVRVRVSPEGRRIGYPSTIVHRIVERAEDGTFRTQGDAKPQADPFPVRPSDIDGRVVWTIPAVGHVVGTVTNPFLLLWAAIGGLFAFGLPVLERRWVRRALVQANLARAQRAVHPPSTTRV